MGITVYKITRRVEGLEECIYIGQTTEKINRKFNRHVHGQGNKALGADILKYGKENFRFEVLATFNTVGPNDETEQFYIRYFKEQGKQMYNVQKGGGRKNNIEKRKDDLFANEPNSTVLNSALLKVVLKSEKISNTIFERYGVPYACMSEELNNRRKESLKERYGVEEPGYLNSKKVYCYETKKVYESVSACARELHYAQPNISRAARGLIDSVGGYHFRMIEN